jgi:hypothetical protein
VADLAIERWHELGMDSDLQRTPRLVPAGEGVREAIT